MNKNLRSSVFFNGKTQQELKSLQDWSGENRSRLIARLIHDAYLQLIGAASKGINSSTLLPPKEES